MQNLTIQKMLKCIHSCPFFVYIVEKELEDNKRVYRGKTDNIMDKRKRTKGQTTIYKTYT
jgi:hypothetical protein